MSAHPNETRTPRYYAALETRDSAALAVVGTLPLRSRKDRSIDLGATMDRVPLLVDAGVTDYQVHVRAPDSEAGAHDLYSEIVTAFRKASGG